MPKMKTKKSATKRVKRTATGKIKFKHPGTGHLLSSKSSKRKRALRGKGVLSESMARRVRLMLP